ncbi:MAG: Hsp70 family protein [Azospirillaceae bacterium]|nr:Hsp70 family protein [Azospirillaceae bacterium]
MAVASCGLDFGTSNTTLGAVEADGQIALAALEGDHTTLPSAVFFNFEDGGAAVGRAALTSYVAGTEGRLMRSIKSALGTALINEETALQRSRISFRGIIARFLAETKQRAERQGAVSFERVVHGRPVHFVDGNPDGDAAAEQALREIAHTIGFREISFQYEPIAAALDYEQRHVTAEEIALVADIGGGTSDFSIVRLGPARRERSDRGDDILANDGVRIGGTDFDRDLSLATVMPLLGYNSPMLRPNLMAPGRYFSDLATWSLINFAYSPRIRAEVRQVRRESARPELIDRLLTVIEHRQGHQLAIEVERAKVTLSDRLETTLDLAAVDPDLVATVARAELEQATASLAQRIAERLRRCLHQAGLAPGDIDAVFLTGGSTLLPHVRRDLLRELPEARVVDGDKFGSVGLGLTLEARRRYG